ncbi:MerR family transcriptional regulator [Frigidibacter sp. RF13]|uniref:MerR family transcriptional regulator n=1 Tax=Frigidibacter sp. RF13 TaxID=2997340 RepID=UPI00226FF7F6|nr:MerR family transcriptional regulator [Frigidibacter sp. RF13]MCY1126016.1 MerR family transcriptional regulator [Frigidibacter sp. RF13]
MRDTVFHSQPTIAPARLAEITGVSPDTQRDWRRRGVFEGIGVLQENGRWLYDNFDVLIVCLLRQLSDSNVDLFTARSISTLIGSRVAVWAIKQKRLGPFAVRAPLENHRYAAAYSNKDAFLGWTVVPLFQGSNLDRAPDRGAASILLDLKSMGAALPDYFDELLPALAGRIASLADAEEGDK